MKIILTFALIALTVTLQTQTDSEGSPDLVVLKSSWSKYGTSSGLVSPVEADPAPGPVVITELL